MGAGSHWWEQTLIVTFVLYLSSNEASFHFSLPLHNRPLLSLVFFPYITDTVVPSYFPVEVSLHVIAYSEYAFDRLSYIYARKCSRRHYIAYDDGHQLYCMKTYAVAKI